MTRVKDNTTDKRPTIVAYSGLAAFVLVFASAACIYHFMGASVLSTAGSLGDFVGGVTNPLIALFGIFLFAMTLHQNSKALEYTRIELEKSSEQMKLSAEALSKQEQHMRHESVERSVLFICDEVNKEINREHLVEDINIHTVRKRTVTINSICEKACNLAYRSPKQADITLDKLPNTVERVVALLLILEMSMRRLEPDVKEAMLVILACKLSSSFIVAMYVEIEYAADNYLFANQSNLPDLMKLLISISDKSRNPVLVHPLLTMYENGPVS